VQLLIVATMTVRRERLDEFREYERAAARIIARHGGKLERAIQLVGEPLRELHILGFTSATELEAYRTDPELAALRPLRDAAVISTEITQGLEINY
jgi:uncharacterized protein (DUF1330 family)